MPSCAFGTCFLQSLDITQETILKYITSDMMQETTKNKLEKEFLYQNEYIVLKIYLPSTEVSKFSGSLSVEFLVSSSIQKMCAFQGAR